MSPRRSVISPETDDLLATDGRLEVDRSAACCTPPGRDWPLSADLPGLPPPPRAPAAIISDHRPPEGGSGMRPDLHLLHGFLQGPVDVFGVDAEFLGGFLLSPGHGVLDGLLDLALADDDEARLAGIDEIAEFLRVGS
jgi:hypothetical protein